MCILLVGVTRKRVKRVENSGARDDVCDCLLARNSRHRDCRCSIVVYLQNLVP